MLNQSRCDQCGKTDDHPKVHVYEGPTYHHDCLPYDLKAQVVQDPKAAQVVAAAEAGTRGDALRDLITEIHATKEA